MMPSECAFSIALRFASLRSRACQRVVRPVRSAMNHKFDTMEEAHVVFRRLAEVETSFQRPTYRLQHVLNYLRISGIKRFSLRNPSVVFGHFPVRSCLTFPHRSMLVIRQTPGCCWLIVMIRQGLYLLRTMRMVDIAESML